MLHPFVSAQPFRPGHPAGWTASVLVHAGLIGLALTVAPDPLPLLGEGSRFAAERLLFAEPALRPSLSPEPGRATRPRRRPLPPRFATPAATVSAVPELPELGDLAALELPEIGAAVALDAGLGAAVVDFGALAEEISARVRRPWLAALAPTGPHESYLPVAVEKLAAPYPRNPRPVYPPTLERSGVEGSVLVSFVVDTTGRVDDASVDVAAASDARFVSAVLAALRRARYFPAEVRGRRVRQLVEQRYSFVISP